MADLLDRTGRCDESEAFAERSAKFFLKNYPPTHPALLRPLQMLAALQLTDTGSDGMP
jgi:hypothetical protein